MDDAALADPHREVDRNRQADPNRQAEAIERIRRTLVGLAILVVALLLLRLLADVLLLVFAAMLIATVLRGASEAIGHRLRIRPGAALIGMLVTLLGVVALAVWLRGPALIAEIAKLGDRLASQAHQLRQLLDHVPWGDEVASRARAYLEGGSSHAAGMITGVATGTLGAIGSLVVLVVAALFFAANPALYVRGTLRLLPKPARPRGAEILTALAHTLRWWFVGQFIDMLVIGTLTAIGLFFIGIPLWASLALLAALFNFVPYVGALAGAVPALLVALGSGTSSLVEVAILFACVQGLEGNVVAPLIQKRTVELPPVVTILSQTVLGTLLGPFGLILATPMMAAIMLLVRTIYVEDVLGDREPAEV